MALGVLRHAGVETWAELVERFPQVPGPVLSEVQLRLLSEWQNLFPRIAWGLKRPDMEGADRQPGGLPGMRQVGAGGWPGVEPVPAETALPGVPVKPAVARKAVVPQQGFA